MAPLGATQAPASVERTRTYSTVEDGTEEEEDDEEKADAKGPCGRSRMAVVLLGVVAAAALCATLVLIIKGGSGAATGSAITFVSIDTRGDPLVVRFNNFTERFGVRVLNLGKGEVWYGFKTKLELLHRFLRDHSRRRDELVAYVDGSDVFSGGCSLDAFTRAYRRIAESSGAPIVFMADMTCAEQDCNKVPDVPAWACSSSGGRNLTGGFWSQFTMGCNHTWDDQCSAQRNCGRIHGFIYGGSCSVPPAMKFLNSGFFVGPAAELQEMTDWALKNYDELSTYGDQSVLASYWLEHRGRVTLDYTGELALGLSDFGEGLLEPDTDRGVVWNTAFRREQCMINGNGRGKVLLVRILDKLQPGWIGEHLEELTGMHWISQMQKERLVHKLLVPPLRESIQLVWE